MVVFNVPEAEKPSTTTTEKAKPPHPNPKPEKPATMEEVAITISTSSLQKLSIFPLKQGGTFEDSKSWLFFRERKLGVEKEKEEEKITESASFKEESNVVGELPDLEKKALDELKELVQEQVLQYNLRSTSPQCPESVRRNVRSM
ncbi:unnamed protein product [Ilex paraguariensis]|uniref:Uncharacterized protein n=1 Tax=Ilex paraguariensis TaxID=185542 RepID=A0ABC8UQH4_9AQUA